MDSSRLWRIGTHYRTLRTAILGRAHAAILSGAHAPSGTSPDESRTAALQAPERIAAPTNAPAPSFPANRFDIVRFPIIPWGFRFQRPQQMLCRFAAAGHRAFYVDASFRPSGEPVTFRTIRDGIVEVSLRGPPLDIYTSVMDASSLDDLFEGLDITRRAHGFGAAVSILDLPFWMPLARRAREVFGWPIVYDCMDHHAGFDGTGPHIVEQETALLRAADLVVVSSGVLEQKARQHSDNVLVARNAGSAMERRRSTRRVGRRGHRRTGRVPRSDRRVNCLRAVSAPARPT
jgi:hypothetical protein